MWQWSSGARPKEVTQLAVVLQTAPGFVQLNRLEVGARYLVRARRPRCCRPSLVQHVVVGGEHVVVRVQGVGVVRVHGVGGVVKQWRHVVVADGRRGVVIVDGRAACVMCCRRMCCPCRCSRWATLEGTDLIPVTDVVVLIYQVIVRVVVLVDGHAIRSLGRTKRHAKCTDEVVLAWSIVCVRMPLVHHAKASGWQLCESENKGASKHNGVSESARCHRRHYVTEDTML
jgi:hypothetical protein